MTTAVYFSTWAVPAETFTGSVEIKNNQIVNATSEEVIFVGYDGEPHKEFAGSVNAVGNTLDSKPVDVVIGVKDEESSALVTATFKDGSTVIGGISGAPSGEANAFLPFPPLTRPTTPLVAGAMVSLDAGDVVAITADTTLLPGGAIMAEVFRFRAPLPAATISFPWIRPGKITSLQPPTRRHRPHHGRPTLAMNWTS